MNLELLNYELKTTNNGILVLYINIQHLYKRPTKVKTLHQQTPYHRKFIRYKARILGFATYFKFFTFLILNKKNKSIYTKSNGIILLTKKDMHNWLIRVLVKKPRCLIKTSCLTTFLRQAKLTFQPFVKKYKIYNFYKNLYLNTKRTSSFLPLYKTKTNLLLIKNKKKVNFQKNWIQRDVFKKKILLNRITARNKFFSKLYYPKIFLKHWRRNFKKTLRQKTQTIYLFKNKLVKKKLEKEFRTSRFFKKELYFLRNTPQKIRYKNVITKIYFYVLKKKLTKKQFYILKKHFAKFKRFYNFNYARTKPIYLKYFILNPKVKNLIFKKIYFNKHKIIYLYKVYKNLRCKNKSFKQYISFIFRHKKYARFPNKYKKIKFAKPQIHKKKNNKYLNKNLPISLIYKEYSKYSKLMKSTSLKVFRPRLQIWKKERYSKKKIVKTRGGIMPRKKIPFSSYKYEKKLKWQEKRSLTILKWPTFIWFFKMELILNKFLLKLFNITFLVKFTQNLHKLVSTRKLLWKIEHSYYYNYQKYRNFQFYKFVIRSFFSLYRYGNIFRVTDQIRFYLERIKRKHTYPIRGFTTLFRILKPGNFMFFKLTVTGKVNYRTRSSIYSISQGGIPLNRFNTQMNYSQAIANAKAGSFTIRLTTYNMTTQDIIN